MTNKDLNKYDNSYNKAASDAAVFNTIRPQTDDVPPKADNRFKGAAPEQSQSGESTQKQTMVDGEWKSKNFKEGVQGWRIKPNGDVEFGQGTFRGDLVAAGGTFSGDLSAAGGTFRGKIEIYDGLGNLVVLIDPDG